MSNLNLNSELAALDLKDRQFRQKLTDEERKKFSPYLMLRYSASVEGSVDLQSYYLMATNENVNKNFFELGKKHDELQWLTCTTVSPGMGKQRHYWHGAPARSKSERYLDRLIARVQEKLPEWKASDVELWVRLNGETATEQWILKQGDELPKR
jgi:hypothetical protein